MTDAPSPARLLAAANIDRAAGVRAETNTCVSKGVAKWLLQVGVAVPNYSDGHGSSLTNVSDFHAMVKRGMGGFKIVPFSEGRLGDILVWPQDAHVSVLEKVMPDGTWRSIGAGGPTGRVAYQPQGGNTGNKPSMFVVVRPPWPATVESAADRVRRIARYLNARLGGLDSTAASDGDPGKVYWTQVQTAGRQDGLYPVPYKIDGVPGEKTFALEKHYAGIA